MPSRDRVQELITLVEAGRFVEAIERFYAPTASMQENEQPPRRGLDTLIEGERRVLAAFKEVRTHPVDSFFVDGDRIVEERFYYDPAQQKSG